jgi:hypothetical protein
LKNRMEIFRPAAMVIEFQNESNPEIGFRRGLKLYTRLTYRFSMWSLALVFFIAQVNRVPCD